MVAVELVRQDGRLTGSFGDAAIDLELDVPNSRAGIHGTSCGVRIDGYWYIESNHRNDRPVGTFLGEYDSAPVHLRSEVHLTPDRPVLRFAELVGAVGDNRLDARITPVESPASGSTVLGIDGEFDGASITLFASWMPNARTCRLDGSVADAAVRLAARHGGVGGDYDGPAELLPLLAGALLYFV